MNNLKSHFRYNKRQRNGIFMLLIIIVSLQLTFFFVDFSSEEKMTISSHEIALFQKEFDSLKQISIENSRPKIYPFNPNYITDFKGYQLGMNLNEIDKLLAFRKTGKFVNSTEEFQEITGVNDSLLQVISPYFKFPEWVTSKSKSSTIISKKEVIVIKDINKATVEDFKEVYGVGDKLAQRIADYRSKLQGFSTNNQLFEVWNLDSVVVKETLKHFQVISPPVIQKINVNTASFKEVLSIVYIDYELTKKIFSYKEEVAEIQSIDELKKIDGFPIDKFDLIALYLVAE
jgi:DNA uptake protein ComE-like DNA-binding protein